MTHEPWPTLAYDAWKDTYEALHMWSQVVGKIALASAPNLNHSWAVALRPTARGLSTGLLYRAPRSFTLEFDFLDHRLVVRASDGATGSVALGSRSVADFYHETMALLRQMSLPIEIWSMPVEVPSPIRFEDDTRPHEYDPAYASRFWRILLNVERVLTAGRVSFVGKCSPAHFFWGSFDLALTRFSGRLAPPREGAAFMRDAYSHEVISHGFWPGSGAVLEPAFYAYAVPEPEGLRHAKVRPDAAFYHPELNEFILPYEAARQSSSPERAIREFVESTYEAAANLGHWDRSSLEVRESPPGPL